MEVESPYKTYLVVTQRDSTTELAPLPTGKVTVLTAVGGLPGPKGDQGDAGPPGQDGAAQIPDILDGGNF